MTKPLTQMETYVERSKELSLPSNKIVLHTLLCIFEPEYSRLWIYVVSTSEATYKYGWVLMPSLTLQIHF